MKRVQDIYCRRSLRFLLSLGLAFSFFSTPQTAKADAMKEFMMSASYGVLAGTLVGAATLAFSDRPGDNLNRVARGASLGLYAGILLGAYVAFGVPDPEDEYYGVRVVEPPRFQLAPLISEKGLEGAYANWALIHF